MMSLRRKTMIKWMSRMTTKLSTKLPWHKRQRIHMFRVSGTVRKGSKTVIYRHHFLFRCSLSIYISNKYTNDWKIGWYTPLKIIKQAILVWSFRQINFQVATQFFLQFLVAMKSLWDIPKGGWYIQNRIRMTFCAILLQYCLHSPYKVQKM